MKNILLICVAHEIPTFTDTDKARGDVTFTKGRRLEALPHPAVNQFNPVTRELYWLTEFTEIFESDIVKPTFFGTGRNFVKDQLKFHNTLKHASTVAIEPKLIADELVKITVYVLTPKINPESGLVFELDETRVLFDHDWNTLPQIRESLGEVVKNLNLSKDEQKKATASSQIFTVLHRIEHLESVESAVVAHLQAKDKDIKISTQHYKPTIEEQINKLFDESSLDDSPNDSAAMQLVMTPKITAACNNVALGLCDTDEAKELEKTWFLLRKPARKAIADYENKNSSGTPETASKLPKKK